MIRLPSSVVERVQVYRLVQGPVRKVPGPVPVRRTLVRESFLQGLRPGRD